MFELFILRHKIVGLVLVLVVLNANLLCQETTNDLVEYSSEFKFKEGVFKSFDDVTHNSPIVKSRIVTEIDFSSSDFFDKVLSKSKLYYVDNIGNKLEIPTSKVWGYSRNGFLYIGIDDGFYRITLMGNCCHFIAYKTYEVPVNNMSPYYGASSYPYSSNNVSSTTQTEMRQYLLDFTTGRILDYEVDGIELVLMNDPELHEEYMQLSNKKKKQLKFVFIRKYNQRNPLYLINNK